MTSWAQIEVECYSGHTYAQQPRALTWRGERHEVKSVVRAWRSPDGPHFLVETDEGVVVALHYDEARDEWHIEEKRRANV